MLYKISKQSCPSITIGFVWLHFRNSQCILKPCISIGGLYINKAIRFKSYHRFSINVDAL